MDPNGDTPLDVLFLLSQPGQEAGNALVKVLTGTVSPQHKTVDTWASNYYSLSGVLDFRRQPTAFPGGAGCQKAYVGYRYFDSFAQDATKSRLMR